MKETVPRGTRISVRTPLLLAFAILLILPAQGWGQVLRGAVMEEETGAAIPFAEVSLMDASGRALQSVVSDSLGEFRLEALAADSFAVRIQRFGYASVTSPLFRIERGEVVAIEARLSPEAVALEPVTVVTRRRAPARLRRFYERAETSHGRIYTREEIERIRPATIRHLLRSVPRRLGCEPAIYLDGLLVERAQDLDALAPPREIEGIEIYRGAVQIPPEFYRPGMCGLVLVWRKPYGEGGTPFTWARAAIAGAFVLLVVLLTR